MAGGGIVVEVTTNNSTELLLPSRESYARNLSCVDPELRSFRSCLRWMCVDQFNGRHAMVSYSLFLLLDIFVPTASHFILSCALTYRAYDMVI
ncbi:hypothetical protein BHE74_00023182 [Ensete ventricosum]|nr:hypothetical protein BHE74_00023182 [Ensete ventricosum]